VQRREETLQQALQWLQERDPAKALAVLDAAPKAYFKDDRFPRAYAQCREAFDKLTAIRKTLEGVEGSLASGNFAEAESLLRAALRTYPDHPDLLSAQQKLRDTEGASERNRLAKQLEEAWLAMGRMQFREAIELLSSLDWPAGRFPDLATEAAALQEEARRREKELAKRQTVIHHVPAVPTPSPAAPERASLLGAQERLREALRTGAPRREKAAPPSEPAPRPAAPPPLATPSPQPPAVAPPRPVPPRPPAVPLAPKAATREPAMAAPVARAPAVSVAIPVPAKRTPVALWVAVGVVAVGLAGGLAWWRLVPHGGSFGYAQVTATPWAEVVGVKTKQGQDMNMAGQTPLMLKLPPGDYVVELKNDQAAGQVEVSVKSGEVVPVKYTFPQVKIDDVVDELVPR
jgi:hypothetical protein